MKKTDMRQYKGCLSSIRFESSSSKGRSQAEEVIIDLYIDDARRLLDCKAFRRLQGKTQVFADPENPHVRDRCVHSHEVASATLYVTDMLGLNSWLGLATALGHDLGHTPFGHTGERVIARMSGTKFHHAHHGVTVAEYVERKGQGLNLTFEVNDGIYHHSCKNDANVVFADKPLESKVVMYCDPAEYIPADIGDCVRMGVLKREDLPKILWELGADQREQIKTCLDALIIESAECGYISFEKSEVAQKFKVLKNWMYENVYLTMDWKEIELMLERIYEAFGRIFPGVHPGLSTSLLNDAEAYRIGKLLKDKPKAGLKDLQKLKLGIFEIIPHLQGRDIRIDQVVL